MNKHAEVSRLKTCEGFQLELSEEAIFAGFSRTWLMAFNDEQTAQDMANTVCEKTTQHCGYSTPHPDPLQRAYEVGHYKR